MKSMSMPVLVGKLKKHAPKMRVRLDYDDGSFDNSDYHSKEAKRLKAQIGSMEGHFAKMTPAGAQEMLSKAHKSEMIRLKGRLAEHEAMCEAEE